jgi:ATP-dependent RNA helicase RhlE
MSFEKLGLSALVLKAIAEKGYETPSPIQAQAIPVVLKRADLMACAQTGTGKTAGFTLPILEVLKDGAPAKAHFPRTLILAPTRELALQIHESILEYSKHLQLRSYVIYGGVKISRQILRLQNNVDILVATPGRLLDLYNQRALELSKIEILVLDEADRMLDMGFIRDIKKIIGLLPKQRQSLMFSATFSPEIRTLAKGMLVNAVEINVAPKDTAAQTVEHKIYPVDKARKAELLCYLINKNNWQQALVFSRTKHGANKLVERLAKDNIHALAIHGNKSQAARINALSSFKQGKVKILVATDIAARGIDIEQLPQVVNFDLPSVPEDYVHRIGRTGRAGALGKAISLFSADEEKQLRDIERVLKKAIEREIIVGFEPKIFHGAPESLFQEQEPRSKRMGDRRGSNNRFNSRPSSATRSRHNGHR